MIDKTCIVKDCAATPCFGFGKPSGPMVWACGAHVDLIWTPSPGAAAPPSPPSFEFGRGGQKEQGRLL